jgi:hypothetical protein
MTQLSHYKNALLQNIQREWEALMEAVEHLTPAQMTAPDAGGWSPKDNLAHLDEWMRVMLGFHIDKRPAHEVMRLPRELTEPWGNFDAMNAALLERNRERPAADVLDGLKHTYVEVVARLQSMPFEQLLRPFRENDPEQHPLLVWVLGDTSEHFAEHRASIEKAFIK